MSGGGDAPSPPDLSKVLGRNTPAGRALHNLYNKGTAKDFGNQAHSRNKEAHGKKLSSGWSPPPVAAPSPPKVIKPEVAVPKFGKHYSFERHMIDSVPRRRPLDVIQREIHEEYERMRAAPMPTPGRAVLDDEEKQRLATLMRYRGKPPAISEEDEAALRKRPVQRSEREELQGLFDAVLAEIEERRAFLQDMERAHALKRDVLVSMQSEIQVRVKELQRIDRLMKAVDGMAA